MFKPKAFINGRIYVSFKPVRTVEAIVFERRVLYTGDNDKALRLAELMGAEVSDLEGRTVMPGFIDCHMHLDEVGMTMETIDLRGVKSVEELKTKVEEAYKRDERGWILGHGWDQEVMDEWPTRWDLDEVAPDRPVMLSRVCLHAAVLNTKAMELTGLVKSKLPSVVREEGEPTGIVKEEAFEIAREGMKRGLGVEDYVRFIMEGASKAVSLGVTSVGFMSVELKALRALMRVGVKLPVRVFAYLDPGRREAKRDGMYSDISILDAFDFLGGGVVSTGKFSIRGIKVLADGSFGARTAWLSSKYADADTEGYPNLDKRKLKEIAERTDALGLQMAVHAIGDAAIDMVLDVYGKVGRGHRLEHASLIREDQLRRVRELGVRVSIQPHFIFTDWWVVKRVGEGRARWVYPFKSMLKLGLEVGVGTDSPVEPLNPWETVYAAVTRGKYDGIPLYRFTEKESLSVEEALHAYTEGSARIIGIEKDLGTLETGKLADLIVLGVDPLGIEERKLRDVRVLETYVSGEKLFKLRGLRSLELKLRS